MKDIVTDVSAKKEPLELTSSRFPVLLSVVVFGRSIAQVTQIFSPYFSIQNKIFLRVEVSNKEKDKF